VDRQRGWAAAGLLGIALVWGASYTAIKDAVEKMPSTDFLAIRFTVAAVIMVALRPGSLRRVRRATLRHGIGLGVGLGTAYLALTVGLERTTPAVAGVLTGLLVVIAALIAAATVRAPISGGTWHRSGSARSGSERSRSASRPRHRRGPHPARCAGPGRAPGRAGRLLRAA